MKKLYFKILICVLPFFISCGFQKIKKVNKELNLEKKEYKLIQKDKELVDTLFKSLEYLKSERIKYRLDKYLTDEYDREQLYISLGLEKILGSTFEFDDNVPKNAPNFNDLDSLKNYIDETEKHLFNEIK